MEKKFSPEIPAAFVRIVVPVGVAFVYRLRGALYKKLCSGT